MGNKKRDSFMPYGLLTNKELEEAIKSVLEEEQENKDNEIQKNSRVSISRVATKEFNKALEVGLEKLEKERNEKHKSS
jgi:predicted RNA-binding protein with PUA-like domain